MASRATRFLVLLLSVSSMRCAHRGVEAKDETLGCPPLVIAAQEGHLEVVKALREAKANLEGYCDVGEWTPLMAAARFGRKDVVEYLVSAGANLEAEDLGDFPHMTSIML